MNLDKLRKTFLEKIKGEIPMQTAWVEVMEVDWENQTMTAKGLSDDLEYYDVLLGLGQIAIKPEVGTMCIIGMIENNDTTPFLIYADTVEDYRITVAENQFEMDAAGFLLKKHNETLQKLMVDLLQEIQKMKFTTNTGSTILLVNKPQFLTIENRFKDFLKDN